MSDRRVLLVFDHLRSHTQIFVPEQLAAGLVSIRECNDAPPVLTTAEEG